MDGGEGEGGEGKVLVGISCGMLPKRMSKPEKVRTTFFERG